MVECMVRRIELFNQFYLTGVNHVYNMRVHDIRYYSSSTTTAISRRTVDEFIIIMQQFRLISLPKN